MSKMGQNFFEMQQDAEQMTLKEFVAKHGAANADLYGKLRDPDPEPETDYVYPGSDCQE